MKLALFAVPLALWSAACPRAPADNGSNEPSLPATDAPPVTPQATGERVSIAAADAASRNLPALGFSLVLADGMGMLATAFPDQLSYLAVSGPPGGPLFLIVQPWSDPQHDDALPAEQEMRRRFTSESDPYAWHGEASVQAAGSARLAFAFETGASMARTLWCAVTLDPPAGASSGLLLAAAIPAAGVEPSCASVAEHPAMAPMLATFRYE
ncbi:MAG: hypothetical protein HY907_06935 [Deltaproteobacteria bacterium]|nr:hypothetical protein [Deltaproteobacteria bacterium]